ncbi:hypothetical protein NSK_008100, partial [Nannochloropsis salina CCMP1776]
MTNAGAGEPGRGPGLLLKLSGFGQHHTVDGIGSLEALQEAVRTLFKLPATQSFVVVTMGREEVTAESFQERKGGRAGGTQEIGREAGEVLNLLVLEAADAPLGGQVFWQGRLIPETTVDELPFFPTAKQTARDAFLRRLALPCLDEQAPPPLPSGKRAGRSQAVTALSQEGLPPHGPQTLLPSSSSDAHPRPADPSQEGVDLVISVTQGHQKENPDKTINLSGKSQQLSLEALYIKHAKHSFLFSLDLAGDEFSNNPYVGMTGDVITNRQPFRDTPDVRAFTLDENAFQRRHQQREASLYQDDILLGDTSMLWALSPDEQKCAGLCQHLLAQRSTPHFTAVILTLRGEHACKLRA